MRAIDADRLLTDRMKSKYYHLPNGDIAIPIIDIEHAPTVQPEPHEERTETHACDLISRQAAIDALGMAIDMDNFRTATGLIHEATVSKVLDCIPAADVAPVVRCRDCKYFMLPHACSHDDGMITAQSNGFCSYGERKE